MRIVHRISQNIDSAMQGELQCLGLHVNTGLTTFEVDEDHPSWKEIKSWIATRDALDVVRTEFSKPELMQAKILRMAPSWHYGYPEPSDDMRFLQETYVESSVCKKCGSGKIQQHPFHLKMNPNGVIGIYYSLTGCSTNSS